MGFFDRFRRKVAPAPPVPEARPRDQNALAELAISSESWDRAEQAADQVTDPELIAKVATLAHEDLARIIAIKKLDDPVLLQKIAESDKDEGVRRSAAKRLTHVTPATEEELQRIRSASGRVDGLVLRCGGCGSQAPASLEVVVDKKNNRGILCSSCLTEYMPLLRSGSDRRFWLCSGCGFRVLAGTKLDAGADYDPHCVNCRSDLNASLVNLSGDHRVASGLIGEPVE